MGLTCLKPETKSDVYVHMINKIYEEIYNLNKKISVGHL